MNQLNGWKVGTIRGVQIRLHFSLLFLLFYVVLMASVQFPFVAKQSGVNLAAVRGSPLPWGMVFAVALFISVLLHEFGHVLMAQALGTKVRGITLMMLGGVSQMDRMPDEDYAEFKIAVVGPLVSLAIAAALLSLRRYATSADVSLFSYWLSRANIALGIFNLLPAFPMDGGRVLRSLLSAWQGNVRGTQSAVKVSRFFAWVFGLIGLFELNILLVLIALFVYAGARSELLLMVGKNALQGVCAGDVGRRMDAILEDLSLDRAAEMMVRARSSIVAVKGGVGGLGVVSADQIKRIPREQWPELPVKSVMSRVAEGVDVNAPLGEVLEHGLLTAVGGVPLLERGRVIGILRSSDIIELIDLRSLEAEAVPHRHVA